MHPDALLEIAGLRTGFANGKPAECRQVGLDCTTCTNNSAASVKALCPHTSEDQQRQLFFRLYPDPDCAPALNRFLRACRTSEPSA